MKGANRPYAYFYAGTFPDIVASMRFFWGSFSTISNENVFFKDQGTRLGAIGAQTGIPGSQTAWIRDWVHKSHEDPGDHGIIIGIFRHNESYKA